MTEAASRQAGLSLIERRLIRAPAERVFAAWTEPARLRQWWGPRGVTCTDAEMDVRVGGTFRLGNRFEDGRMIWISGEFLDVQPPRKLVYTWMLGDPPDARECSRVTVRFETRPAGTEVIVIHEQLATAPLRDHTTAGWRECLSRLAVHLAVRVPNA